MAKFITGRYLEFRQNKIQYEVAILDDTILKLQELQQNIEPIPHIKKQAFRNKLAFTTKTVENDLSENILSAQKNTLKDDKLANNLLSNDQSVKKK